MGGSINEDTCMNGWFIMETPIETEDCGYPEFVMETPICTPLVAPNIPTLTQSMSEIPDWDW